MNQSEKDVFISQELRFYDLSNIFFESSINDEIFEQLKEIFFSINNISQIYFDKDVDVSSIEKVKYLLEISPTMNDAIIDKYILNVDNLDIDSLFDINFHNSNWWILYKYKNNDLKTFRLDEFKDIHSRLTSIIKRYCLEQYSLIEKVAFLYDYCKRITLDNSNEYSLRDALKNNKANSDVLIVIFHKLLCELGIKNFIGESVVDKETSYVLIAHIIDEKYDIDGIYLFDLLSDYVDDKDIPDKKLKTLNYNYFCILLKDFSNTIFSDRLVGILKCFIHDIDYDMEKISYVSRKELSDIEDIFENDFLSIHGIIDSTHELSSDTILKILYSVNSSDIHEKIKENYYLRNSSLKNYDIDETTEL